MKKIIVVILTVVLIAVIYLVNLDNKVFFVALGDSLSLGKTDSGFTEKNYNFYLANHFSDNNILEKYVNEYVKEGLRINDVINDINNNKKISVENKIYNIKNLLIKADLVTISINHDDIINKLDSHYSSDEIYNLVDELIGDYEKLLVLLRDYCKETIIVLGYYFPNSISKESQMIKTISYLNDSFKEISGLYKIEYIDPSELLNANDDLVGQYYPTELGYKAIAEKITLKLQKLGY